MLDGAECSLRVLSRQFCYPLESRGDVSRVQWLRHRSLLGVHVSGGPFAPPAPLGRVSRLQRYYGPLRFPMSFPPASVALAGPHRRYLGSLLLRSAASGSGLAAAWSFFFSRALQPVSRRGDIGPPRFLGILCVRALLSDPGGVLITCHSVTKTAAFRYVNNVGFCPVSRTYPMTTMSTISGLNHTACSLAPSGFGLPSPGLPADFATDLLARLWSGGIFTVCDHPLGNIIEFHRSYSNPNDLRLTWRDYISCLSRISLIN